MKRLAIFTLLAGLALSAPTSKEDDRLVVTSDFFPEELKIHAAEHEIVNILVPLNALNFDDDDDDDDDNENSGNDAIIFFVEADITDGVKDYKGISVIKNKQATKLLETGTDASAANDDTKTAYFGATDGLYVYNDKDNTAEKYGTVTDSIISLAKVNGSDIIYILTNTNELFKVTEEGTKKDKIADVVGAQQIVLDYSNNLYYYNAEKEAFVVNADGVKKIEGLPANPTDINLIKPPFVIEDGVPVIVDNKAYIIYVNGSSELTDFEFVVKPTAFAMEATLVQYYAYNKQIYEYNILTIIFGTMLEELKSFLDDKSDQIQSIATRSRSDLVP